MPRPRQRRGADAKKAEKQAKREAAEAEARAAEAAAKRARHTKSKLEWDQLAVSHHTAGDDRPIDPDALPEVNADTKAYFKAVSEQIAELEQLGHGRANRASVDDETGESLEEDTVDDRQLLLRSALESLSGNEMALAGDQETSIILEKLLYAMDDLARRTLANSFAGQFERLIKHRSASHVLQTLFTLASETVDRETRGILPAASSDSSSPAVSTMTALLLGALSEMLDSLPNLLFDPFASHTIRILLRVFAGSPPPAEGQAGAERSKRSHTFRQGQAKMDSFLDPSAQLPKPAQRKVPQEFANALESMWESLNGLDEGGPKGEGVRRAAMDDVAGPAVRIMLELEADPNAGGWLPGGWADRVLCGLVEEVSDPSTATPHRTELREEYLAGLLRHPASSPTCETLLSLGSQDVFNALWSTLFKNKLHRLAGNQVANYVVAVGIARLDAAGLEETLAEVDKVGTERRGEWIDNSRTGVLKAFVERAVELKSSEQYISDILIDTFQLSAPDNRKMVLPCVLSLNRLEHYRKLPAAQTSQPSTQGSILLQSWLKLSAPHHQPVLDSIFALSIPVLLGFTRDPTSSRVLDAVLSSPAIPPSQRRKFLMNFIGHYHIMADDRIGSRVAERCWSAADVYLKDKIAASLVSHQGELQSSQFGHFFARKVEIPLWQRRREEWKAKMASIVQAELDAKRARQPVPAQAAEDDGKKRKERPADEIDDIFALAPEEGKSKKSKH